MFFNILAWVFGVTFCTARKTVPGREDWGNINPVLFGRFFFIKKSFLKNFIF